jgi:hypothetical protein
MGNNKILESQSPDSDIYGLMANTFLFEIDELEKQKEKDIKQSKRLIIELSIHIKNCHNYSCFERRKF